MEEDRSLTRDEKALHVFQMVKERDANVQREVEADDLRRRAKGGVNARVLIEDALYLANEAMTPDDLLDMLPELGLMSARRVEEILERNKFAVQAVSGKWWHRLNKPW